ncbi:MAG: methyltransferase DNA modification enzyme [Candidatus Rifleibacterium amylolyticum]|nr:MAG: methyltransferase DNA modification enzyme [Candidatus Rifleibacterium amylolyticum]
MSAQALLKNIVTESASQPSQLITPFGPVTRKFDEFWTAKQRQMHSLHYANSYRASFKPELPEYFISRFTNPGDRVGDPFGGRGTTILQAALMNRKGVSNDVNPLSERLAAPKINPVTVEEISERLDEIDLSAPVDMSREEDMSMFYHEDTYRELINLRNYLMEHRDDIDRFIEMTALSRLHGHSNGFFSAYSFPQISIPKVNQAKINKTRGIEPDYRDIKSRILKKAKTTLKSGQIDELRRRAKHQKLTTGDSRDLKEWESESVNLVVTSPPFLNQVDYVQDTWIETWFCGIPREEVDGKIVQTPDLSKWMEFISDTMSELHRVLAPYGLIAMEVGEVRYQGELLNLDEILVQLTCSHQYNRHQFRVKEIYVQSQQFTKLANCFRVENNKLGTNTNRIVLMEKI